MSSVLQTLANLLGLVYAPSGTAPQLKAFGVDADIDINLVPKGDGVVLINGLPLGVSITETFTLTPAQIRSLNTSAVDLVVPANANTFLAPGQCVFVGAQGSGAYSTNPGPVIQYAGNPGGKAVALESVNWDGSAPAASLTTDVFDAMASTFQSVDILATSAVFSASLLGLALQISSGGDVTGGDAPCTIILTYRAYDLTGLL